MSFNRSSSESTPGGGAVAGGIAILVVVALILGTIGFFAFTTTAKAGEVCLKVHNGAVKEVMDQGRSGINRAVEDKHCITTLQQVYEIVSGDPAAFDSNADYVDWTIKTKTKEGIDVWVALSLKYHVIPDEVRRIYENIAKTDRKIYERIVQHHTRNIVPDIVNRFVADELYYGQLNVVSTAIQDALTPLFLADGVSLDSVEFKRGDFDNGYEESIRQRALNNEAIKAKQLEQQLATEEAERKRIETEGNATALQVQTQGEQDAELLRTQGAATRRQVDAESQAAATITTANAEAQAIAVVGAAYEANPAALELERINAIASAGAIYLPSDTLGVINLGDGSTTVVPAVEE